MIITYQQKRVFHLSLLMLALCAPIYIYSVPFPNEQFYYINSVLFLFIIMCTLAYFKKRVNLTTTFSIILIAIHIEIFIEIIYCSICSGYEYSYQRALIMSNITISLLFTMLSICAYMSNISILFVLPYHSFLYNLHTYHRRTVPIQLSAFDHHHIHHDPLIRKILTQ